MDSGANALPAVDIPCVFCHPIESPVTLVLVFSGTEKFKYLSNQNVWVFSLWLSKAMFINPLSCVFLFFCCRSPALMSLRQDQQGQALVPGSLRTVQRHGASPGTGTGTGTRSGRDSDVLIGCPGRD